MMINNREYTEFQFETSDSLENVTTEMTTFPNTTTTIPIPSNGLSSGALAGIISGTIVGVIGLFLIAFIIYKYRERFVTMLHKDSKQSNDRSIPNTLNKPRPNITYAPEHEYLTVNTFSSPKTQQSDEKAARPNNHRT